MMVYQEQVMQILNKLGKIPLAAAYTCIKAISKKKEKLIAQNHEQFIDWFQRDRGSRQKGCPEPLGHDHQVRGLWL